MEKNKAIDFIVLFMFIVLVGILLIIGLNFAGSKTNTIINANTNTKISNSYNKVVQDTTPKIYYTEKNCWNKYCYDSKTEKIYPSAQNNYMTTSHPKKNKNPSSISYWKYTHPSSHTRENYKNYDSWGNSKTEKKSNIYYINTFEVKVKNYGSSDYFRVRFYFEDCWGEEKAYEIRKYIYTSEEEIFYYRDLSRDQCEYDEWRYKVFN